MCSWAGVVVITVHWFMKKGDGGIWPKRGENRCARSYEVELDWQRGDLGPYSPSRPSRSNQE